jgi:hypothetical protein
MVAAKRPIFAISYRPENGLQRPESAPFLPFLIGPKMGFTRRSAVLALSRKPGEKVVIGNGITLTVVESRAAEQQLAAIEAEFVSEAVKPTQPETEAQQPPD